MTGIPVPAAPDVEDAVEPIDVQKSLLNMLEEEEGPEESPAQAEPETEPESGEAEAQVETEEQQAEAPKTWKVKVEGEELDVPEDELVRGYSRQQDYTRKTMKLAEERKTLESEAAQVRAERAQYAERLEAMKTYLETNMGAEPNWEALRAEDPAKYAATFADWQRQQVAKDKVVGEQQRIYQQQVQDQQTQLQQKIAEERGRLLEALPEWKSADTMRKESEALIQYGTSVGFTEDELGNLYDHRAVLILDKARKYDALQEKGKAVKEKAVTTPVLKPGSPKPPVTTDADSNALAATARLYHSSRRPFSPWQ